MLLRKSHWGVELLLLLPLLLVLLEERGPWDVGMKGSDVL
jgi:hypothetical protein